MIIINMNNKKIILS